jgi:hypothetical protein
MNRADCLRMEGLLVDRAYGELESRAARALEAHLAGCAHCRESAGRLGRLPGRASAGDRPVMELLDPEVRSRLASLLQERQAVAVGRTLGRWTLAAALAGGSWLSLASWPILSKLSGPLSLVHFLAWLGLYDALIEGLTAPRLGVVSRGALRSRAVAYGVLASVALFVASMGGLLAWDSASHWFMARHLSSGLSQAVALLSSSALLVVGLCMGVFLGRESSLNMIVVLAIYAGVMFPALTRGTSGLLRPEDRFFGLLLVLLWGLSGAHLGAILSDPDRRQSAA